mgnify:CR=1 FL=1|tara:strand:+ start:2644 stop:3192 length:549 start_codon:yes stop_codon:yes gene_type:complete
MSIDNFVRVYDNCLDQESCDRLINEFKLADESSAFFTDNRPDIKREDKSFLLHDRNAELNADFNNILDIYIRQYCDAFTILNEYKFSSFSNKMQKTEPCGGYHIWHCENNSISTSSRILTWLFYLNDVDEGGETELLYQSMRVKPKTGRLVIFPAAFTHTHRGNPPISNTKYIVTGWYHLTE